MSQENVEVVRRAFEEFNRGGPRAAFDDGAWSPELVFDATHTGVPGLGTYKGRAEVTSLFEDDWWDAFPFEEWEIHLEEVIDCGGDLVVANARQRARGATSGASVELEVGQINTVRDGRVEHIVLYLDRAEAMRNAGVAS
jgi:ketosteroid isomerase-like protein